MPLSDGPEILEFLRIILNIERNAALKINAGNDILSGSSYFQNFLGAPPSLVFHFQKVGCYGLAYQKWFGKTDVHNFLNCHTLVQTGGPALCI